MVQTLTRHDVVPLKYFVSLELQVHIEIKRKVCGQPNMLYRAGKKTPAIRLGRQTKTKILN